MPLEQYQHDLKNGIYRAWNDGADNVCATMATGLGKSYTVAYIVRELVAPTVVIAHRTELVSQLSLSLAAQGVRHALSLPSKPIQRIVSEHIRQFNRSYYDDRSTVRVVSAQSVVDSNEPWMQSAKYWITDECFVAGTMVETPHGSVPIEDIKSGDMVLSFNERNNRFEHAEVLACSKTPVVDDLVQVFFDDEFLICTKGHPFLTERGWISAANLKQSDRLLRHSVHAMRHKNCRNSFESKLSVSEDRQSFLSTRLRVFAPRFSASLGKSFRDSNMSLVSDTDSNKRNSTVFVSETKPSVLFDRVFERVSGENIVCNGVEYESKVCFGTHASEEPDVRGTISQENVRVFAQDRTCSKNSQRERSRSDRSGNIALRENETGRVCFESRGQDFEKARVGLSATLQNRFGESDNEDCGGNRRELSFFSQRRGCEKDGHSDWIRVESVEIFKSRRDERSGFSHVYNLHVAETNTYIANGVVVHNCHHLLKKNLWGRVVEKLPNARGLGVTATPIRAEGAGLGSHADGVFDALVEGPQLGAGIELGFLTPYRIVCSESDIEIDTVPLSDSTGDYNQVRLREAVHRSKSLIGDMVQTYRKWTPGKAAIAFVVDIEEAGRVATAFKAAGIPAEAISSKTPPDLRAKIMDDFRARRLFVLVNVDLFGEGVDIPSLEVVIMARHTASLSLFLQQVGRALRLDVPSELRARWSTFTPEERRAHVAASRKPLAYIIDHVGNVVRHNLPCMVRPWSLDRRERKSRSAPSDAIPLTTCLNESCMLPYERHLPACPYCGIEPAPPPERKTPAAVDGDMVLLDPSTLRLMEAEVRRIDGPPMIPQNLPPPAVGAVRRNHFDRQEAQRELRESIALWAGYYARAGEPDRAIHKRFFLTFGMTILEAEAYGTNDANTLRTKIDELRAKL